MWQWMQQTHPSHNDKIQDKESRSSVRHSVRNSIKEEDRNFLRFLWWYKVETNNKNIATAEMWKCVCRGKCHCGNLMIWKYRVGCYKWILAKRLSTSFRMQVKVLMEPVCVREERDFKESVYSTDDGEITGSSYEEDDDSSSYNY